MCRYPISRCFDGPTAVIQTVSRHTWPLRQSSFNAGATRRVGDQTEDMAAVGSDGSPIDQLPPRTWGGTGSPLGVVRVVALVLAPLEVPHVLWRDQDRRVKDCWLHAWGALGTASRQHPVDAEIAHASILSRHRVDVALIAFAGAPAGASPRSWLLVAFSEPEVAFVPPQRIRAWVPLRSIAELTFEVSQPMDFETLL